MTESSPKMSKAPRNRTIDLSKNEIQLYREKLVRLETAAKLSDIRDKIICGNTFDVLDFLPSKKFDLLFSDPPYNLTKNFGTRSFKQTTLREYENWLDSWLSKCVRLLKDSASVYICGDWRSASAIQRIGMKYFKIRNRITWEREKGRGAKSNWKNSSEDIWFFTVSDDYFFDAEAVKLKRKVIAPYRKDGKPKDWEEKNGQKFRLTSASNLWNDLTVPFWSMPENTVHPTQKPEKLLAKIILASTTNGALVLDPFAGSGTTGVAARKLMRNFVCIDDDENFCLLAQKRLSLATEDKSIQGFSDGVFWERNSKAAGTKK